VDGLPLDGMQEVWGSNPHSSTGQAHNSNNLKHDFERLVALPGTLEPGQPPLTTSSYAADLSG
jgi:hypothetical protein